MKKRFCLVMVLMVCVSVSFLGCSGASSSSSQITKVENTSQADIDALQKIDNKPVTIANPL